MDENVKNSIRTLGELTNRLAEKRAAWAHQLLVAGAALFGVLISLQTDSSATQHTRATFALALVSLALGILLTAIVLYSHLDAVSRARIAATQEAATAFRERRAMKPVAASERKIFVKCEKASYICFALSVVLLSAYSILFAFEF